MIPVLARLRLRVEDGPRFRLWFPLPLLYVLLLPFLVLALPFLVVACLVADVNPLPALAASARVLAALRGTSVEVESREVSIRVHIR
ncbi:MAG TPA: hypothetical protein VOB72_25055 [Candidatus Dormibacteraeota bacterium]|nr:hypothetical protein [Candidatus Dormibacteraeota bacterium]